MNSFEKSVDDYIEGKYNPLNPANWDDGFPVCIVGTNKHRHIAVEDIILCGFKTELPDYDKTEHDTIKASKDGYIEFLPLSQQKYRVNEKTLCERCRKHYERLIKDYFY